MSNIEHRIEQLEIKLAKRLEEIDLLSEVIKLQANTQGFTLDLLKMNLPPLAVSEIDKVFHKQAEQYRQLLNRYEPDPIFEEFVKSLIDSLPQPTP